MKKKDIGCDWVIKAGPENSVRHPERDNRDGGREDEERKSGGGCHETGRIRSMWPGEVYPEDRLMEQKQSR